MLVHGCIMSFSRYTYDLCVYLFSTDANQQSTTHMHVVPVPPHPIPTHQSQAASITLLLPHDAQGILGHHVHTIHPPHQRLTALQLLQEIHHVYTQDTPVDLQLQAMQVFPGELTDVAQAFALLSPVPRWWLLGSHVGLRDVVCCSRGLSGCVYEVRLEPRT